MSKNWIYSENERKLCDEHGYSYEWINGSTVKNHISLKTGVRIQCNTENFVPIRLVNEFFLRFFSFNFKDTFKTGASSPSQPKISKKKKTNEKEPQIERSNMLCSDIPEWLQEFREMLVDDEGPRSADLNAVFIRKTEITTSARGPRLRGPRAEDVIGRVVLCAENFGDLIAAEDKVLKRL